MPEKVLERKAQFDYEKNQPLEDPNTLQDKFKEGGNAKVSKHSEKSLELLITKKIEVKRESFGEDYDRNLKKGELQSAFLDSIFLISGSFAQGKIESCV